MIKDSLQIKRLLLYLAKLLVAVLLVYAIYHTLFVKHSILDLIDSFEIVVWWPWFIGASVLVIPNVMLEAWKWQKILLSSGDMRFVSSLRAVLAGVSLGMISPARVGEYAGRIAVVSAGKRGAAGVATFISSLGQSVATILFGLGAALVYSQRVDLGRAILWDGVYIGGGLLLLGVLLVYFNISRCLSWLGGYGFVRRYLPSVHDLDYGFSLMLKILLLSGLRYVVYTIQYILILKFYGSTLSAVALSSAVGSIYLIQSLLPLPFVIGLLARGEIALLILSPLGMNEIAILLSTLSLWVINLVFPAIIGFVFLLANNPKIEES